MTYIVHRGGDGRFVLQSGKMGMFLGLMILPLPGETPHAFSYDFGTVYQRQDVVNIRDFPELAEVGFFAIEYPGFHDFDRYLRNPDWQSLRTFLMAEAKTIGYSGRRDTTPAANPLPTHWRYTPPNPRGSWHVPAWALWVDDRGCWRGDRDGLIVACTHDGELNHQHQLSKLVRCLTGGDNTHLYASCDDGEIYDLTGKLPQAIYNARNDLTLYSVMLQALMLHNRSLLVLDIFGVLTCVDLDGQVQWQQPTHHWRGWWLRADDHAIYVGHSQGVTCHAWKNGSVVWHQETDPVLCGDLSEDHLWVGTSGGSLHRLNKACDPKTQQTDLQTLATGDGAVYACALVASEGILLAADYQGHLSGMSVTGDHRWTHPTDCGAILTMQVWGDRLYAATTHGTLACFTLSSLLAQSAVPASPQPLASHSPLAAPRSTPYTPHASSHTTSGIVVQCIKQGGKLKVYPCSPGYHAHWAVQFPSNLRQESAQYRVDGLTESKQGGFYRVVGHIHPVEPTP
ncbi:MAG: WGR domain-containing protein [Synechococcales cyanobacterium]